MCDIIAEQTNDACLGCPEPCTRRGLEGRCATHRDDKPRLEDPEFGTEIEVIGYDYQWRKAKWCGFGIKTEKPYVLTENGILGIEHDEWRLPIESRIRKGQPLVCGSDECLLFFSHFDDDLAVCFWKNFRSVSHDIWRLPTKEELKRIGQDNLGWLTSD